MKAGDRLTLTVDKPAAGGRMIARHDGAIVLVAGAIPGEIIEAQVEKMQRGMAFARTIRVLEPSADRVAVGGDWRCGGNVFAHVAYARQVALKRDIIRDGLARIGRMAPPGEIEVAGSPVNGYRMRARLHVVGGRIGFFKEGTHHLCEPGATGQLSEATLEVIRALEAALRTSGPSAVDEIEITENCAGDERALHLALRDATVPPRLRPLPSVADVRGVSCGPRLGGRPITLWGTPAVSEALMVPTSTGSVQFAVTRHAHAFFQGNRFLLGPLVSAVLGEVPAGRILDLYAGVGLFAAAVAARGGSEVIAIEGDAVSARDLRDNAAPYAPAIEVRHQSVELFLQARQLPPIETVIVDPPRTGMTREALRGALGLRADRLVYVSCDIATFARDARLIVDSGYALTRVCAFDLFPQTAHVETIGVFVRADYPGVHEA